MRSILVLFIVSMTLFTSCKSAKVSGEAKSMTARKVIQNHQKSSLDELMLKSDLVVGFKGNIEVPDLKVSLRLEKDKAVWISLKKLGFPVGKLMVTPDSVKFYEKINRRYFEGDFELLKQWMGVDFDFDKVQNLFLGNALFNLKNQKFYSNVSQDKYLLEPKEKNPIFEWLIWINAQNFKVAKEQVKHFETDQSIEIIYDGYNLVNEHYYPKKLTITTKGKKSFSKIDVDYKNTQQVYKLNFPFSIPKNYKKIEIK